MWTPFSVRALRYAANVIVKVLPSPVFISAILPSCKTTPPIIWTSKCLSFRVRLEASLTNAKASGKISSNFFPFLICSLKEDVFIGKSKSSKFFNSSSREFIFVTIFEILSSSFWLLDLMNLEIKFNGLNMSIWFIVYLYSLIYVLNNYFKHYGN